jgi:hypothetical protein
MDPQAISYRLWFAVTAFFDAAFLMWEHQTRPQLSFWTGLQQALSRADSNPGRLLSWCGGFVGLNVLTAGAAGIVLILTAQLVRRLYSPPATPQDADYDDGPWRLAPARPTEHTAGMRRPGGRRRDRRGHP